MKSDVKAYRDFLESLLDPEAFGYAVTEEVRNEAKRLLGHSPMREAMEDIFGLKPTSKPSDSTSNEAESK